MTDSSLTVWADRGAPPAVTEHVLLWDQFLPDGAPLTWISLPDQVHERRTLLRGRYQKWLAEFQRTHLQEPASSEVLLDRGDFNYWWMTIPALDALENDSFPYRVTRLMLLQDYLESMRPTHLILVSVDDALKETVRRLCADLNINFRGSRQAATRGGVRKYLSRKIPSLAAARVFVSYLTIAATRRRTETRLPEKSQAIFVDYWSHLESGPNSQPGRPNYWGNLVNDLRCTTLSVTWLHLLADYPRRTSFRETLQGLQGLAHFDPKHFLLQSQINVGLWLDAFKKFRAIRHLGKVLRSSLLHSEPQVMPVGFWLDEIVGDQYFGRNAALNAFTLSFWNEIAPKISPRTVLIYLMENQAWEYAMLAALRGHGLSHIYGFAHSTIPFWDTRYLRGHSINEQQDSALMPMPAAVICTGQFMATRLVNDGYPPNRVVIAEPLHDNAPLHRSRRHSSPQQILVLGDYDEERTRAALHLVNSLRYDISDIEIRFRPHPAVTDGFHGASTTGQRGIQAALCEADLVIACANTSAALDAAKIGIPTLVIRDPRSFTSTPAEGYPNVRFISGSQDLAQQLQLLRLESAPRIEAQKTQDNLSTWRFLLQSKTQFGKE